MKTTESIECAIRVGAIARTLLQAHGTNEKSLVLMVIREVRKLLDEFEAKVKSFEYQNETPLRPIC